MSTEKEDPVRLQHQPDVPAVTNIESAIEHAWPTPPTSGLAAYRSGACSALTSLREVLARPLRLVDRFSKNGKIRHEETLDYGAGMRLATWYGSAHPSADESQVAQNVMQAAKQRGMWLACGCRPDVWDAPPILGKV